MKHLPETAWKTPSSYSGFSPVGDYCVMSVHRESDLLTQSNWIEACKLLDADSWDNGYENYESRPHVYHWRARHCLVGWIEYLMVRQDAPAPILESAESMLSRLDSYPVLNEDAFCEREFDLACEQWESYSLRDRMHALKASGSDASLFSIRSNCLPSDNGSLVHYLAA